MCREAIPVLPHEQKAHWKASSAAENDDNWMLQNLPSKSKTVGGRRMPPPERCSQRNRDSKTHPPNHRDQRMLRSATGLRSLRSGSARFSPQPLVPSGERHRRARFRWMSALPLRYFLRGSIRSTSGTLRFPSPTSNRSEGEQTNIIRTVRTVPPR
jgi:hypothetical protein